MKKIIIKNYDISKQTTLHGLTPKQYIDLMEYQNFECALSGNKFEYKEDLQKFIDVKKPKAPPKAPPIDHDHETMLIRGILTEKTNWLVDQWEQGSYGKLSKPQELSDYQKNPPAFKIIGKIKYKK